MFVEIVRRRYKHKVYEVALLRETYREGGKVKHRTLANLSALPAETIDLIRRSLKGEKLAAVQEAFRVVRSRAHGAVWAVWQVMRGLGLPALLGRQPRPWHARVFAMVVARVVRPGSKLGTVNWWRDTSLAVFLDVGEDETVHSAYRAMDELLKRQAAIERQLARRHLGKGQLVLCDVSSSYLEGRHCPLAARGYSRDGKRGKLQIVYGLLCNQEGCPVAIEVFAGGVRDAATLPAQLEKLRDRFDLEEVVVVGDRGLITRVHRETLSAHGYGWITALRAPQLRKLCRQGLVQFSLFDQRDLAEIVDPSRPGRRLVVCRNPLVAAERRRKREDLLRATEADLARVQQRVAKGRLHEQRKIALAVGKVLNRFKVGKHFELDIRPGHFGFARKEASITGEAALDGLYVIETTVPAGQLGAEEVVAGYKSLRYVEQAFRSLKTMDHEIRPFYHRLEDRVRAHAFLCMLAYYVKWHMVRALAPLQREQPDTYRTFRHVLNRLGAIQLNTVEVHGVSANVVTQPDEEQQLLLDCLGVRTLAP